MVTLPDPRPGVAVEGGAGPPPAPRRDACDAARSKRQFLRGSMTCIDPIQSRRSPVVDPPSSSISVSGRRARSSVRVEALLSVLYITIIIYSAMRQEARAPSRLRVGQFVGDRVPCGTSPAGAGRADRNAITPRARGPPAPCVGIHRRQQKAARAGPRAPPQPSR